MRKRWKRPKRAREIKVLCVAWARPVGVVVHESTDAVDVLHGAVRVSAVASIVGHVTSHQLLLRLSPVHGNEERRGEGRGGEEPVVIKLVTKAGEQHASRR